MEQVVNEAIVNELSIQFKNLGLIDECINDVRNALVGVSNICKGEQKNIDEAYQKGLFYRIIATNAVYHEELCKKEWYISTNVSGLFANVITRLHHEQSLSDLLDNRTIIDKMIKASRPSETKDEQIADPTDGKLNTCDPIA